MEQTLTKVRKTAIFVIALIFVCFHIYIRHLAFLKA